VDLHPGLNPTAGLAGRLHLLGVDHPWLTAATAWCWSVLEAGLPEDAHGLAEVLVFLEYVPTAPGPRPWRSGSARGCRSWRTTGPIPPIPPMA